MNSIRTIKITLTAAGVLGCIGLVAGAWFLLHAPLNAEAAELTRARDELRDLHDSRPRVIADNRARKETIDSLKAELKQLNDRLPDAPDAQQMLHAVSRLARDSDVTLPEFQPGGESQWGELHSVIVRLQIRGTYAGICRFLRGLESMERVSRVTQLNLRVVDRVNGRLQGSIDLHGLYRKPLPKKAPTARRP